jgi:chromosome segregation ATPase
MTQNFSQWLEEIKTLQQQLAEREQERDAANASADRWRELYNKEAQQRRTEASLAQQTIESLKAEIQRLESELARTKEDDAGSLSVISQEVDRLGASELKAKLAKLLTSRLEALQEVERLTEALKAEQAAHAKTRHSLTTALGDTMDRLKAARAGLMDGEGAADFAAGSGEQMPGASKIPSLKLPRIKPAQPPA